MNEPSDSIDQRAPLTGARALVRFAVIGAVLLAALGAFAYAGGWLSPHRLTQARMMAAFQSAGGNHPGFRRNHAKGLCVTGWFESNGNAATLSKAAVFAPGRVPLMKPDPASGKPSPAAMQEFLARHPETVRALTLIRARTISSSFADSTYNSLDAFRFVNASGISVPVRWATVPVQEVLPESGAQRTNADKNYLFDELIARIQRQPQQWRLVLTIGQPGDPTDDATLPWPEDRRHVDAGLVSIDRVASEDQGSCTDVNYDPLVLPPGIEPSDDPLLSARSAAYARSFTLRAGEKRKKPPSAVTTQDVQAGGLR